MWTFPGVDISSVDTNSVDIYSVDISSVDISRCGHVQVCVCMLGFERKSLGAYVGQCYSWGVM